MMTTLIVLSILCVIPFVVFIINNKANDKYIIAYNDLVYKFCEFLEKINIYDIKDKNWFSNIIYDKNSKKFILYENILNESVSYFRIDMEYILYIKEIKKVEFDILDKNYIESQLKLPIFNRHTMFTIFDGNGTINQTYIQDLCIEKPFKNIFTITVLAKLGYDVDILDD